MLLNDPAVWEALLERMPLTALLRSLAKLTAVGVLRPLGDQLPLVLSALSDAGRIAKARLHPLAILMALRTYAQGREIAAGWYGSRCSRGRCLERRILHGLQDGRAGRQADAAGVGRVGLHGHGARRRVVTDPARGGQRPWR